MNIIHDVFCAGCVCPDGIEFNFFHTMSKHIMKAMLPDRDGEVHKLSLHEGEVH
jgi:hypothetical protein